MCRIPIMYHYYSDILDKDIDNKHICVFVLFFSEKFRWMNRNSGGMQNLHVVNVLRNCPSVNLTPDWICFQQQVQTWNRECANKQMLVLEETHSQKLTWQLTGWGVKSPLLKTTAVLFAWKSLSALEGAIRQRSPATFVAFYYCTSIHTKTQWLWYKVTATQ